MQNEQLLRSFLIHVLGDEESLSKHLSYEKFWDWRLVFAGREQFRRGKATEAVTNTTTVFLVVAIAHEGSVRSDEDCAAALAASASAVDAV